MARVLAIDYGTRRTGIAVTDPLRLIAGPLETVATHTMEGSDGWLARYFATADVDTVVVGRALQMSGEKSQSMEHIEPFFRRLTAAWPDKKVVWHDERFTSVIAQRAIIEGGVRKMARRDKALVDKVSASLILQSYLETINN